LKRSWPPFIGTNKKLLEINGPDVFLAAEAVQIMGLALHELATNATKFGALSSPLGKIAIRWGFHEGRVAPDSFLLTWQEHDGPPVKPSGRKGFGSFVMEQMIKRDMSATVTTNFAPNGMVWTLDMPASYAVLIESNASNGRTLEHDE